jgi:hypothetical protein
MSKSKQLISVKDLFLATMKLKTTTNRAVRHSKDFFSKEHQICTVDDTLLYTLPKRMCDILSSDEEELVLDSTELRVKVVGFKTYLENTTPIFELAE